MVSSMMWASGRYATYESPAWNNGFAFGYDNVMATALWCEMHTPFEVPVVPDVYMMTARSDADGSSSAVVAELLVLPLAWSSSRVVVGTPRADASSEASPIVTTISSVLGSLAAAARRIFRSLASQTQSLASVCVSAVSTPSSPNVAYAVTTTAPRLKHASAATIQSRCVSAYSSTRSPLLSGRPAASASTRSSSCEYVHHSNSSASVSFSNLPSNSRFTKVRHPTQRFEPNLANDAATRAHIVALPSASAVAGAATSPPPSGSFQRSAGEIPGGVAPSAGAQTPTGPSSTWLDAPPPHTASNMLGLGFFGGWLFSETGQGFGARSWRCCAKL
mmetsp:Transcript_23783/g.94306  ORF Transcript_23783/g.94306 Transcript_23783/m.94306 type:complete len:333 (-) Transcript_23783:10-1008(-)